MTHRLEVEPRGIGRPLAFVMARSAGDAAEADMGRLEELLGRLPAAGGI